MPMILVTGASGFIGTHLTRALVNEGHEVIAASHTTPLAADLQSRVTAISLDVSNRDAFTHLPSGIDAVFHLAIYSPRTEEPADAQTCMQVNAIGTANVLEFCRTHRVPRLIYSSSVAVYGTPDRVPLPEDARLKPESFYAVSKIAAEQLCHHYRERWGQSSLCLRYASVYGPGQRPYMVLPLFLQKATDGEPITIFGDGSKVQDFVYIRDVVHANLLALKSEAQGVVNIGSGVGTPVVELAETILEQFPKTESRIIRNPEQQGDQTHICLDIRNAQRHLGYEPHYSVKTGIKDSLLQQATAR